ncbi:Probable phospholipid hydroperoxide glutathione peroxidase 6, mitochondrial [Linum perenne]
MLCSSIRNFPRKNLIFAASSLLRTRPLRSISSLGLSDSRFPHQRSVSLKRFPALVSCSARFDRAMASNSEAPQSIYDFTVKDARGNDVDLSTYKGKVLLIVNVASQCGLTNSNYTELTELYKKYKDQGLEILAFPCNQFGSQEPGNNEQIMEFACTRFKAEYPIFDKKGGLFGDGIKWNFAKFLINKEGQVVDRYAPTTSPLSFEVTRLPVFCHKTHSSSWSSQFISDCPDRLLTQP